MTDTELANLRRARSRCHMQLKNAEVLVAGYQTKLADLEARIQAIAPELQLPARHRSPNPRQSYQANKRRGSSPTEALFKHFDHPR